MNDNETVDDVLADMLLPRFDAITAMRANNYDEIKSLVANYRDRIKAAYKRERGDCAKLREALEKCANWGEQIDCQLGSSDETVYAFRDERCLAHNISECARAKYWDKAWNPIVGCKPCSPACENCYAAAWAKRFGQSFEPHATKQKPPRSGVVFCGNMTDLFGEWMYTEDIANNIGRCVNRGGDAYLWLTKRPARMCDVLNREKVLLFMGDYDEDNAEWFRMSDPECNLSNHYFGFTAENQEWYDRRFRESRQLPDWANWWISAEPLLGPIDLGLSDRHPVTGAFGVIPHLPSWVVVGCESGPNRRPCKIEWVESIVEQCRSANIPVFVKQLDIGGKCEHNITKFPKHLQIRQVPWATKGENK